MLIDVNDKRQTDFVSKNVTIKIAKKKKYWKSLLITNSTSPRIIVALQKKAHIKFNNLARVQIYLAPELKAFVTISFVKSRFNYCLLI